MLVGFAPERVGDRLLTGTVAGVETQAGRGLQSRFVAATHSRALENIGSNFQ